MISPSDLPWWGWLLCSLGAWIVCWIAYALAEDYKAFFLSVLVAFVSGLTGLVTGCMALILFVKWVWTG
jgi:hypothetical protein